MQVITLLLNNFVSVLSGGGVVAIIAAFIKYKMTRPEAVAKARSINVTSDGGIIEYQKGYIERLEKRLGDLESKVDELKKTIEKKDTETARLLKAKDEEIALLKRRVGDLEEELKLYKKI